MGYILFKLFFFPIYLYVTTYNDSAIIKTSQEPKCKTSHRKFCIYMFESYVYWQIHCIYGVKRVRGILSKSQISSNFLLNNKIWVWNMPQNMGTFYPWLRWGLMSLVNFLPPIFLNFHICPLLRLSFFRNVKKLIPSPFPSNFFSSSLFSFLRLDANVPVQHLWLIYLHSLKPCDI